MDMKSWEIVPNFTSAKIKLTSPAYSFRDESIMLE